MKPGGLNWICRYPRGKLLVDAAEGDSSASQLVSQVRDARLDQAWGLKAKSAQKEGCWQVLLESRELPNTEATSVIAAFMAHDPTRTLPKIARFRPVAVVIADSGEIAHPWPTDGNGVRRSGRLLWFLDQNNDIGQISWPKVAMRAKVEPKELVARAARLTVHDQIEAFRSTAPAGDCELCREPMGGLLHVDHIVPFDELLDDWVQSVGTYESVAQNASNPPDCDPQLGTDAVPSWSAWHRERARLRMTHKSCNLRRPRT